MLAWLLFSVFSHLDMTYESLEKREFSLLDDLVQPEAATTQNVNHESVKNSNA